MPSPDREAAARAIDAFLRAIGRDSTDDPELAGTGQRVADAFLDELCSGYAVDTKKLLEDSVIEEQPGGLVVVRDIQLTTMCPHHLLLATGTATVAIHGRGRIVGLGAVAALVAAHSKRLTLQERIGEGIVADLDAVLAPEWVGCRLVLAHGCMIARGERAASSRVETVALRGASSALVASAHAALGVGQ